LMFAVLLGWNVFLVNRDVQLFKVYDSCKTHPNCVK